MVDVEIVFLGFWWRFEDGDSGWHEPLCPLQNTSNSMHKVDQHQHVCCFNVCSFLVILEACYLLFIFERNIIERPYHFS